MTANLPSMTPASADQDHLRSLCVEVRGFLVDARRTLDEELRSYPTPIPRCDAQFNYVYEQRTRLSQLLGHLDAGLERSDGAGTLGSAIAEFAASPPVGESVTERELRKRVCAALMEPNTAFRSGPRVQGSPAGAG